MIEAERLSALPRGPRHTQSDVLHVACALVLGGAISSLLTFARARSQGAGLRSRRLIQTRYLGKVQNPNAKSKESGQKKATTLKS